MTGAPDTTSVILCTRDRPAAFQRALASVLAQDAQDFELIVVDGSDPAVVVPPDAQARVRVIAGERRGEGQARAAGLRAARGAFIAWCDDDDEWTPDHLRTLRDALLARPDVALVHAASDAPPRHAPPAPKPESRAPVPPPFALRAGDVLHRAAAAQLAGGFDQHLDAFAAGDLWTRIAERGQLLPVARELTRHHCEPSQLTEEQRDAARERLRVDWERTARRTREAHFRIHRRRAGLTRFNPATWRGRRRELLYQTVLHPPASFALVSGALIPELQALGVRVTLGPLREGGLQAKWGALMGPAEPENRLGFVYDFRVGAAALRCERLAYYAMWPTTGIPAFQVEEINRAAALLYVPCQENVRMAQLNGVSVPARVLPHGVDARQFPYLERRRAADAPYIFGSTSQFHYGKGIDVLIRAFTEEFRPHEPVRLRLNHSYQRLEVDVPDDPRIVLTNQFLDNAGVLAFYGELDAYVLPTRGEGFGLTGLEALSTGLPLIATNWSGPAEYLDPADTYPLRYELVDAAGFHFMFRRHFGRWAEPDVMHLRELLRHVYEHRDEAAERGRRAAERVHREWTWARVARQLVADFDLLAQGVTPS